MEWATIPVPVDALPLDPMTVRAETIPKRHHFPEHSHCWNQMVYAISGVLTVHSEGRSFVISPEQAVWLPPGIRPSVGSLLGGEFRSLWIAEGAGGALPGMPTVFSVSPLLPPLPTALPWPCAEPLSILCETLYRTPDGGLPGSKPTLPLLPRPAPLRGIPSGLKKRSLSRDCRAGPGRAARREIPRLCCSASYYV